jgi:hemolysin activation/secretion protein
LKSSLFSKHTLFNSSNNLGTNKYSLCIAKTLINIILIFSASLPAFAQRLPDAGIQLQQITNIPPPKKTEPKFEFLNKELNLMTAPGGQKIQVLGLKIVGTESVTAADLITASRFVPDSMLSYADLKNLTVKMVAYLHEQQYFVAQVFLPPQEIENGMVVMRVMEGKYSRVDVQTNQVISQSLATTLMDDTKPGEPIKADTLARALLLVSDLPGVEVASNLAPGAQVGTSDLKVDITGGPLLTGSIDFDNFGNTYTGSNRVGATLNVNNPSGHGDLFSVRAQTSAMGMDYGRISYQTQVGKFTPGIALTALQYQLGQQYESLSAYGTAQIASVYLRYPVVRSRVSNMSVLFNFDVKKLQDNIDATNTQTPKRVQVASVSTSGDIKDDIFGGGFNTYYVGWSVGNVALQSQQSITNDARTAQTNGLFNKLYLNATRLQKIAGPVSLYTAFRGQIASKNMDGTEMMGLGGANGVRAYPEGEGYGDEGYVLNIEARTQVPNPFAFMPGKLQLIGFFDHGSIIFNKNPWSPGINKQTLSGVGIGVNWFSENNSVLRMYLAQKVGAAVPTSASDQPYRFWVQFIQYL